MVVELKFFIHELVSLMELAEASVSHLVETLCLKHISCPTYGTAKKFEIYLQTLRVGTKTDTKAYDIFGLTHAGCLE